MNSDLPTANRLRPTARNRAIAMLTAIAATGAICLGGPAAEHNYADDADSRTDRTYSGDAGGTLYRG